MTFCFNILLPYHAFKLLKFTFGNMARMVPGIAKLLTEKKTVDLFTVNLMH